MDIKSGYWTFLTVLNALIADPKSLGGSSPLPGPQPGAFGARASFPSMRPSGAKAPWSTCCRWAGAPSCAGGTSWAPPTIPRPPGSPPRGRCGGSRGLGAALPRRARRHPDQRCGSLPDPWGGRRLRCFRRGRRGGAPRWAPGPPLWPARASPPGAAPQACPPAWRDIPAAGPGAPPHSPRAGWPGSSNACIPQQRRPGSPLENPSRRGGRQAPVNDRGVF